MPRVLLRFALLASALLATPACSEPIQPVEVPAPHQVDQNQARKLALQKYRHLFHNAYVRDHRTGDYHAYPELDEARFNMVESRGDAWLVRAEPLAGWIVRARVAKNGDWVDLHEVSFAAQ